MTEQNRGRFPKLVVRGEGTVTQPPGFNPEEAEGKAGSGTADVGGTEAGGAGGVTPASPGEEGDDHEPV